MHLTIYRDSETQHNTQTHTHYNRTHIHIHPPLFLSPLRRASRRFALFLSRCPAPPPRAITNRRSRPYRDSRLAACRHDERQVPQQSNHTCAAHHPMRMGVAQPMRITMMLPAAALPRVASSAIAIFNSILYAHRCVRVRHAILSSYHHRVHSTWRMCPDRGPSQQRSRHSTTSLMAERHRRHQRTSRSCMHWSTHIAHHHTTHQQRRVRHTYVIVRSIQKVCTPSIGHTRQYHSVYRDPHRLYQTRST